MPPSSHVPRSSPYPHDDHIASIPAMQSSASPSHAVGRPALMINAKGAESGPYFQDRMSDTPTGSSPAGDPYSAQDSNGSPAAPHASATSDANFGKQQQHPDESEVPSWVGHKTKAGKERKRLPLACQACRRKKVALVLPTNIVKCTNMAVDQMLGRTSCMQTLREVPDTLCLQDSSPQGSSPDRLHGHAGQTSQAYGRPRHKGHAQGRAA